MKVFQAIKRKAPVLAVLVCSLLVAGVTPLKAYAATTNTTPAAKVSFTFDDGLASTYTQAAPTLAKHGFTGTNYVTTGCIGMTTVPNTCKADTDKPYMSWAQLQQLQNTYKWEIGSHTASHPLLASTDAEIGQTTKLTTAQVRQELTKSKSDLAAKGITATAFAPPFGDYDMPVLAEIAKEYSTMRGFADTGYNTWPNNDYLLRVQQVQSGVSVATVKGYVDTAIAKKQWLVLVFHNISTNPSTNPDDYEYKTSDLDQIAAYVKSKNLPVVNPSSALVTSDVNLLANGSFNNGIADGWTTDAPTGITKDTGRNGSYPDPTNSLKFVASTKNTHLFSPKVLVDANTTYMLRNFVNVQKITSGELGFYIDEYDGFGNWISGQYKSAERSVFVENINFSYKPTSANVAKASLQVFTTANSGITAYLDNVQWFPLTATAPTPPPAQQNMLTNGTFDNGIANGWTTDNATQVVKDTLSNGSPANVVSSIKMTATTKNTHLFAPKVIVDATKTYSLSSYINLKQITGGEVAFYIDEYDVGGNWISGQYKPGASVIGAGNVNFAYKPTSVNVKTSQLQVIVVSGGNITVYVDDIKWLLQ